MKQLVKSMLSKWPAWLAIAFFALLPFGRLMEIPLSGFAIALPFLARADNHRQRLGRAYKVVIPLFLCFWLPMLFSCFDSFMVNTSWMHTLAALRFPAATLSMAVLLHGDATRRRVIHGVSWLLVFWAVDGFVQLILGTDLLGIPMNPDRLNALFVRQYQFYGPTLAILSPLLLEYARRYWPGWAWVIVFSLTLGAVLIAGMRAGWLIMGLVVMVYGVLVFKPENRELRKISLAIPALVIATVMSSYQVSPLVQARLEQSLSVTQGSYEALNTASTLRLPIFKTSLKMFTAHPFNGVGVRAYPKAYMEYAGEDDIHLQRSAGKSGATHAHNVVLEVMADTGSIGVLGMLAGFLLAMRFWKNMSPATRQVTFPFCLSLALLLFPLNSYFAIYGTYLSSLIWVLCGLWAACLDFSFDDKTALHQPVVF